MNAELPKTHIQMVHQLRRPGYARRFLQIETMKRQTNDHCPHIADSTSRHGDRRTRSKSASKSQNMSAQQFLIDEFKHFAIGEGLRFKNEEFPVYNLRTFDPFLTGKAVRRYLKEFLTSYLAEFVSKTPTGRQHEEKIRHLSNGLSEAFGSELHERRFRIGVSQKIVDLFFKYCWSANLIQQPPHCPSDGRIQRKIERYAEGELFHWTELDSIEEYRSYVRAASLAAEECNRSLAEWGLVVWKRS